MSLIYYIQFIALMPVCQVSLLSVLYSFILPAAAALAHSRLATRSFTHHLSGDILGIYPFAKLAQPCHFIHDWSPLYIMKLVYLFTDGACKGNPGPGGWGAILRYQNIEKEISGGEADTTNNRMELTAMIRALQQLREPCEVIATSDSKYLLDGLQKGWAKGWRGRGWKKSDGQPALNADLWELLLDLTDHHKMEYHWIRGHAGHPENERADRLAVAAAEQYARPYSV